MYCAIKSFQVNKTGCNKNRSIMRNESNSLSTYCITKSSILAYYNAISLFLSHFDVRVKDTDVS